MLRLIIAMLGGFMSWSAFGLDRPDSLEGVQGIWERTGYGDVYLIGDKSTTLYQYTRATCLELYELDNSDLSEWLTDIEMQEDEDVFLATSSDIPAFRLHFSRLNALPDVCHSDRLISNKPTETFEHLWHTFNDYYAFFNERGVDWNKQYDSIEGLIHDKLKKKRLFKLLSRLLAPIDDGHVYLESNSREFSPESLRGSDAVLAKGFEIQSEFDDYDEFTESQFEIYNDVLLDYLDSRSIAKTDGDSPLLWATVGDRIGYLLVEGMASISDSEDATTTDDIKAINTIMDRAMNDLKHTRSLIIDVRFNGGGYDSVGLAIANRFTDKRQQVISKTARNYSGETESRYAYLVPEGETPYLKPVVIIAGPDSASATEVFILAMRALPQVTLIGQPTNGIFSDELYKLLPNGWEFNLSNEVYYDHLGVSHEGKGVPPDISVNVFSLKDNAKRRNAALEMALGILRQSDSNAHNSTLLD